MDIKIKRLPMILFLLSSAFPAAFAQNIIIPEKYSPVDIRWKEHEFAYVKNLDKLDTVCLRVEYLTKWRETTDAEPQKNMEALYIGEKMSEYRENRYQYASEHVQEDLRPERLWKKSIDSVRISQGAISKIMSEFHVTNYTIHKNVPKLGMQRCYNVMLPDGYDVNSSISPRQYYEETMPMLDWNLMDGDTIICNYACQRASTTYRGRTWQVWYTPDLPYQDGPWKLQGLPGLILKAEDTSGDFCFEAIEIRRPIGEYIVSHPFLERHTKSTFKRVMELTKLLYSDPGALYRLYLGDLIASRLEKSGQFPKFSKQSRTPCLIEKYE